MAVVGHLRIIAALVLMAGCARPGEPGATPTEGPQGALVLAGVGDTVGHYRIDAVHADRLEGMDRYPYPVLHGDGEPRTLRVEDEVGAACEGKTYVLKSIDSGAQKATFREKLHDPSPGGCPICLSADTLIDTPSGPVPITDVRIGSIVWGLKDGGRVALPVEKVSRTAAPGHTVVHLVLEDGRSLDASAGHPLADGGLVGELRVGDTLDVSRVSSAERVAYAHAFTHDLRVGEGYWANGILVGSSLS